MDGMLWDLFFIVLSYPLFIHIDIPHVYRDVADQETQAGHHRSNLQAGEYGYDQALITQSEVDSSMPASKFPYI